jgi:hypothetical protein
VIIPEKIGRKTKRKAITGGAWPGETTMSEVYRARKALTIKYNPHNLPRKFDFGSGKVIDIVYDATGQKLAKTVKQGSATLSSKQYAGGMEYEGASLEAIYHAEGRLTPSGAEPPHRKGIIRSKNLSGASPASCFEKIF